MFDKERVIQLASTTVNNDTIGQPVQTETTTDVIADLRSVTLTEWTNARQLGLSASYQAVVWSNEYSGQEYVYVSSKKYHVYRTYETGDKIELYLEEMVGHA